VQTEVVKAVLACAPRTQAEHPVAVAHLARCVTDEGDIEGGDLGQHLVRADRIQRGEPGEQRDGDAHPAGHADAPS
jgi:hypothetical protein